MLQIITFVLSRLPFGRSLLPAYKANSRPVFNLLKSTISNHIEAASSKGHFLNLVCFIFSVFLFRKGEAKNVSCQVFSPPGKDFSVTGW